MVFASSSILRFLASGCASGYAPFAPGTAGSIVCWLIASPMWIYATRFTAPVASLLAISATSVAILITRPFAAESGDPQWIVIDEWAGLLCALFIVQPTSWRASLAVLVLFRIFDALKPPPVGMFEKLPGAWGIVLDDVVAGILAALVWLLVWRYIGSSEPGAAL